MFTSKKKEGKRDVFISTCFQRAKYRVKREGGVRNHVERSLKGDIQMWHILSVFMILRQDTAHASEVSVQQQD